MRTTDGGVSWIKQLSLDSAFYDVSFTDSKNGIAVGYPALIYRTTNGGKVWINQPHPYSGYYGSINGVYLIDSSTGIVVGDYGKIGKTTDAGATWFEQISGTNEELRDVYFWNNSTCNS